MYSFNFCNYEHAVKTGAYVNNPEIVSCYVGLGLERAKNCPSQLEAKRVHIRMSHILEEALCDTCLPLSWRKHCFRYLRKLKPLLFEIMNEKEYLLHCNKLNDLYEYFLAPYENAVEQSIKITPKGN